MHLEDSFCCLHIGFQVWEIKKNKIKNLKAVICTEIQDGRHANMKNICLLIILFFNIPRKFFLVSTYTFLGLSN